MGTSHLLNVPRAISIYAVALCSCGRPRIDQPLPAALGDRVSDRLCLAGSILRGDEARRRALLALAVEAGVTHWRHSFRWSWIEEAPGVTRYDAVLPIVEDAARAGVELVVVADYG